MERSLMLLLVLLVFVAFVAIRHLPVEPDPNHLPRMIPAGPACNLADSVWVQDDRLYIRDKCGQIIKSDIDPEYLQLKSK